jgi:cytochrome P450
MMGVSQEDMPKFRDSLSVLTDGMSGWNLFRTLFWDMGKAVTFSRDLIARKRADPQDDILTGLIQAEEAGDKLTEDELVSMLFLLVFAGYETTVHLITNSVVTLLQHPEQLARLREEPALLESAIEEILRFNGPIQGTKPMYSLEAITLHGVTIPKKATVVPLLGAANRDPAVFPDPDTFDIARSPNRHLGFGQGIHYCLGAPLARLETRIALRNLLERNPNLRLAIPAEELSVQTIPLWHRYERLPVVLG